MMHAHRTRVDTLYTSENKSYSLLFNIDDRDSLPRNMGRDELRLFKCVFSFHSIVWTTPIVQNITRLLA